MRKERGFSEELKEDGENKWREEVLGFALHTLS